MPLLEHQKRNIAGLLSGKILDKLATYQPETSSMPFHIRLLGEDRMALYSFIHSCATMLGQSIFEKIAVIVADPENFEIAADGYKLHGRISQRAVLHIDAMLDDLRKGRRTANKQRESEEILAVSQTPPYTDPRTSKVDVFLRHRKGAEYYIELKTAKPNIDIFTATKKKLLEWIALRGSEAISAPIYTLLCIPYNPYEPEPYGRWTLSGLFDLERELLVGEEFWDFLGGPGTYKALLAVFEGVGMSPRPQIDKKFSELGFGSEL